MNVEETLLALSPLDGRYQAQTAPLRLYFSEYAFLKYRVIVEIRYLIRLSTRRIIRPITKKELGELEHLIDAFLLPDAARIKMFEQETQHDVKAVEYFLKEKLTDSTLSDLLPFVHFGLTSEDVNNLAYGMMLTDAHKQVILPEFEKVLSVLREMTTTHAGSALLALTHGQPAVPTTFGKELAVFYVRLKKMYGKLRKAQFDGKMTGAVGTLSAHVFAYPKVDWLEFSTSFVSSLGLSPVEFTTQILPGDNLVEYVQILSLTNGICMGFAQDFWQYISRGLVKQHNEKMQVGSSTMPQKINPINFENAEGNLQIANSYFDLYARKFLVSRLQRDLSDSTVKRTLGTALGHTLLAWKSLTAGISKVEFDSKAARTELDAHWEILSEAIQIFMKVHGDAEGYEKVKRATMGKVLDEKTYRRLVKEYPALARLTPESYSGLAKKIAELATK